MDPERAADLLARERARVEFALEEHQAAAEADSVATGAGGEPEDLAAAINQFETDSALVQRLRSELAGIAEAEFRLKAGTYGISVISGDVIPDERLEALPWADRTVEEAD